MPLAHDGEDQLLVHDHVLFAHEGGADSQHPIGAPRALVDVGDKSREQQSADLAVTRHVVLELVVTRTRDPDDPTGRVLPIAQVA
jgi:hypothetical protein